MRLSLLRVMAMCLIFPLAAVAPAACTTTGGGVISQTLDEKAIYTVQLAYAGGLAAVEAAVDSGQLRGEQAAQAVVILDRANAAVALAQQAYDAGQTIQAAAAVSSAWTALGELRAIIPRAGPS
jgi:hypothetical protein